MTTISNFCKKYPNVTSRSVILRKYNSGIIKTGMIKGKILYIDENELKSVLNIPDDFHIANYMRRDKIHKLTNISGKTIDDYVKKNNIRMFKSGINILISFNDFKIYIPEIENNRCKKQISKEKYMERMKNILGNEYLILEDFSGLKKKIKFYHKSCKKEFITTPESILYSNGQRASGTKCPYCYGRRKYTQNEAEILISNHTNGMYKLISKYKSNKKYIDVMHLLENCKGHNRPFKTKLNTILSDNGGCCPYCQMSNGEDKIFNYLSNNNIDFEYQSNMAINSHTYRFDFKIGNIFIEFDGKQHFEEITMYDFMSTVSRDKIKNEFISNHSIYKLFRISYKNIKCLDSILDDILNYENRTFRDYPLGEYEQVLGKSVILSDNIRYIG